MDIQLYPHQWEALTKLHSGNILCGDVGSGKSRTALAWYFVRNRGGLSPYKEMLFPKDLYIITTARKRDTGEWIDEMAPFGLSIYPEDNMYHNKVIVDSWNNLIKYKDVTDAYFLFDEQRVVGYGQWAKTFIHITKSNAWILLTATPGDTWTDYIPVFIANGFYRHKTDFWNQHVISNPRISYQNVQRYVGEGRLIRLRNQILVRMEFKRHTTQHHITMIADYDKLKYKDTFKNRKDPKTLEPIENPSELCFILREISNADPSRANMVLELSKEHKRMIIFYTFDYERNILLNLSYGEDVVVAEWSGHKHEPVPKSEKWIYLVQYSAGSEAWNCTDTDTTVFYSQTYSYKTLIQASGRIDRMNTPFTDLWYYHIQSKSPIDLAIAKAISKKKNFNESNFLLN